jgi:hypothetical protein
MVEGKWLFPKIYEQYYNNYLFLRKKKMNLFKNNLILNNNYSLLNNNYNLKYLNYINICNILKLNYIYNNHFNLNLSNNINNFKINNLYKFKKLLILPLLYHNNNNNNNDILNLSNIQERFNNLKKFQ